MRWGTMVLAVGLLSSSGVGASPALAQAAHGREMSVVDAVTTALRDNPGLRAARLSRQVAASEIDIARQRPNPDVLYEGTRETPHHALTLSLPIETAGKRLRRVAVSAAVAATTDADIALIEADVRASTKRAFYALLVAQLRQQLGQDLLAIGTRARDVAQARVQAGDAARMELVQVELARARLENDATGLSAEVAAAGSELNALLGRPPASAVLALGPTDPQDLDALLGAPASIAGDSPEVVAVDRRAAEARARVDLANVLRTPDLVAQTTATYKAPPDFMYGWRVGASVTVPLFHRSAAGLTRERTAAEQARLNAAAARVAIAGRLAAVTARIRGLWAQRRRELDVLVPQAQELADMAEEAYRSGQIDLTSLLQTLQASRDVRMRTLDTVLSLQLGLADWERTSGVTR